MILFQFVIPKMDGRKFYFRATPLNWSDQTHCSTKIAGLMPLYYYLHYSIFEDLKANVLLVFQSINLSLKIKRLIFFWVDIGFHFFRYTYILFGFWGRSPIIFVAEATILFRRGFSPDISPNRTIQINI